MANLSQERKLLEASREKNFFSTTVTFLKLEGPGWWLAGAAVSSGAMVGSIGLGAYLGLESLWIQSFSMLLGVLILCCISHITLGSQQSLFQLLRNEWNPTLAWWLAGSALITNFAWCMPQFRFGAEITGTFLLPSLSSKGGKVLIAFVILVSAVVYSIMYERSGQRARLFHWTIKSVVFLICAISLLSLSLLFSDAAINFGDIFSGLVPTSSLLSQPAPTYLALIENAGEMGSFWNDKICENQRSLILTTFSSTLGVNLLFAFPLLILGRGWERGHKGFASFNLWTTLFIPFFIFSTAMVILSSIAFHGKLEFAQADTISPQQRDVLEERLAYEIGHLDFEKLAPFQVDYQIAQLSASEIQLSNLLSGQSVEGLISRLVSISSQPDLIQTLLGLIVLLVCFSTILVLMMINGHLVCEVLGKPHKGASFQSGSLLLALSSIGPFIWQEQSQWVADPTYFISLAMLPFALLSIFLILNSREILGRERPRGISGWMFICGNALAVLILGASSLFTAWNHTVFGIPAGKLLVILIGILLLIGHFTLRTNKLANKIAGLESRLKILSDNQ
jgi:Mn2+/Fe2+ NRAMP family transporter